MVFEIFFSQTIWSLKNFSPATWSLKKFFLNNSAFESSFLIHKIVSKCHVMIVTSPLNMTYVSKQNSFRCHVTVMSLSREQLMITSLDNSGGDEDDV